MKKDRSKANTSAVSNKYLEENIPRRSSPAAQAQAVMEELSQEEVAVAKRLVDGQTNSEIATALDLSLPLWKGTGPP